VAPSVKLTADMRRLLNEQRLGFVASVCEDGTPNLSPKGTTTVWDDEHIVFADICSPGTVANIRHQAVVEINVVDPVSRRGYRFKGPATVHQDGPLFEEGLAFYRRRGSTSPIHSIVWVRVERASALLSPAYDQGQREEDIRASWLRYWGALYGRDLGDLGPAESGTDAGGATDAGPGGTLPAPSLPAQEQNAPVG
jgi:predicted pyridoxine 5'-phosphate oxidase superfamily flavin-nucleotide-binding protein